MYKYLFFFLIPFFFISQNKNQLSFSFECDNVDFGKPNRTFGGSNWYAGFSDHLPVYCKIEGKVEIFSMFYNVENLFDTIDDPNKNDSAFLPNSEKKWNTNKYLNKLGQLERVFAAINSKEKPNIIGLCEVENKLVIEDLLKQPFFDDHTYQILHQESPDSRGIDCAILFDEKFKLIKSDFINVKIPGVDRPTRDIVYAQLQINNDIFNVFVNHWSSRWGGTDETAYKRIYTANVLREYIEKNIDKGDKLLIMGDFNDYPSNNSIKNKLLKTNNIDLINLMSNLNCGSYKYKGEWGWLDQIIVSSNLIKNNNQFYVVDYGAFVDEWMLYRPKNK